MKVKIIKITNKKQDNINYELLDAMLNAFVCLSHKDSKFSNDAINDIIEKIILNKNPEVNKENVNDGKGNDQDSKMLERKVTLSSVYSYSYHIFDDIIDRVDYFKVINFNPNIMGKIIDKEITINSDGYINTDIMIQRLMFDYRGVDSEGLFLTYKCIKDIELLTHKKFVDSYKIFKDVITEIKIHRMKLLFDIFTFIRNFYESKLEVPFEYYIEKYNKNLSYLNTEISDISAIIRDKYLSLECTSIENFINNLQNTLKSKLLKIESDFIYDKSK